MQNITSYNEKLMRCSFLFTNVLTIYLNTHFIKKNKKKMKESPSPSESLV